MGNEEEPKYWGGRFEKLEDFGKDERLNMKSIKLFTDGKLFNNSQHAINIDINV